MDYNKYLEIEGNVKIEIDYQKFNADKNWEGLKGYITNTELKPKQIIDKYQHLWQIEKAFRISKTDLKIRPIYQRVRHRIEAHICIAFTAYSFYKELERLLYKNKAPFSVKAAIELTHIMYQLTVVLPESKHTKNIILKMDDHHALLKSIVDKIKLSAAMTKTGQASSIIHLSILNKRQLTFLLFSAFNLLILPHGKNHCKRNKIVCLSWLHG